MINKHDIPRHIAIIMDGNGRWARKRRLPRVLGHREGVYRVREAVKAGQDLGVKVMTFFAFSSENWNRPKKEIDTLMSYFKDFLGKEIKALNKNNIKFMAIGRRQSLSQALIDKIKEVENSTKHNTALTMILAINYGGRQEIIDAAKKFAGCVMRKEKIVEELNEETFQQYLYAPGLPDPDLFIRTSGEMRLSNFLLWQLSYSEFYFTKKFWPDFHKRDLEEAIEDYQKRERRFGGLDAGKKNN